MGIFKELKRAVQSVLPFHPEKVEAITPYKRAAIVHFLASVARYVLENRDGKVPFDASDFTSINRWKAASLKWEDMRHVTDDAGCEALVLMGLLE